MKGIAAKACGRTGWKVCDGFQKNSSTSRDGADAYMHYMDGSGSDCMVDFGKAYEEDESIRQLVDEEVESAQRWAEKIALKTGRKAFSMTGDSVTAAGKHLYPATENWQKALGDFHLWGSADVSVEGNKVTMKLTVHVLDRYDFNLGSKDLGTGTLDSVNGRSRPWVWRSPT
ncbi:hypothetical protein ACGF13_12070 [Kitasatospora sp. NPDC048286]|uniref:hypothetical protein n=1 Tax=Kitasatospora sp. NPDC048286 TaxID=3364047 RepID=UPI003715F9C2